MQSLTANEIAILKSKIQAGASGHSQKVILTANVAVASTLRNPYYVSATLMPNGQPALLFRALDTPYTGGTEKVYLLRYKAEHVGYAPQLLFPYNTAILSITTYKSLIVAVAYDAANTRIRMRTSADYGVTWSAEATVPAGVTFLANEVAWNGGGYQAMILRANKAQTSLYLFFINNTTKNVRYRVTTNADPTLGWSADTDSGFNIFSVGRNYGGVTARNQGDSRAYAIVETKTAGTWIIACETNDGDWHANHGFHKGTLGGTWTRTLDDGYGGGLSGGQGATGNVFLDRNGDVIGYFISDDGDSVGWWKSTDSGATWSASIEVGPGTIGMGEGDGLAVPGFETKEFIWGGRAALYNTAPLYADLLIIRLSSSPVKNIFSIIGQGSAGNNMVSTTTTDVSNRVISISLDKAMQLDSDTFNLELHNEDGALNINIDTAPGALAKYAQPNVTVDISQWHGVVANAVQTFHGIVDSARQHDSPRTIVFTGRCGIKKLLTQEVRLIAPQDLKVTGYVRDTSNFVYLNKTLNEVINHVLDYASILPGTRALAPSTFVFKELRANETPLVDLVKRACDVAGMDFWCDELGTYRTAPIGAVKTASAWTYRSYEDITVLDPDVDDDATRTRVRVIGRANMGAKFLAEQFKWPGPETPGPTNGPAAVAYDPTTKTVWVLTQNSNLYRLNPAANMAIVAGPFALGLGYPDGLAVDPLDNHLWVSDGLNATVGNNAGRVYKKINRATQALMLGPFTNPDGDHCAIWAWNNGGTIQLKMSTFTTSKIYTMSIAGATISSVASPVTNPTALTSDTGGGLYLSGWDATDFYQVDFAGNIVNAISQPAKNGNAISAVEDPAVFDFGSVYEAFRDQNVIYEYAPTAPSGDVTTYAEVVADDLELALLGEVRLARITDLAINDKAQATATGQAALARLRLYSKHTTFGALGNPGVQKADRITIAVPGASINGDWTVTSLRSDQNARDGTYLMVLVCVPYRGLA